MGSPPRQQGTFPPQPDSLALAPPDALRQSDQSIRAQDPSLTRRASTHAHVTWLGPAAWTADELATRRPRPSRRRARDFLKRLLLAAGPRSSDEVWTAARQLGLSRNTLYRAKDDLQVQATRSNDGQRRLSHWFLPEHAAEIPSETPELDAWLNRWHELNIDANPLEKDEQRRFAG